MANINISKDSRNDAHYRYKMPQLQTKVEGKGNGVKTVLPNITDIARALSRPPTYPTKFFGCELGAQTMWDEKADRYIVNGIHDAPRLRELLDNFIDKFVLCVSCKNPETDIFITKDENILRDCKACGVRKPVDMRHKLCTFILKNPPIKTKKGKKGAANGDDANGNGENEENGGGDASGDDEMSRKIAAGAKDMSNVAVVDAEDVDWSADTSKAAVAARIQALNSGIRDVVLGGEEDGDDDEASVYNVYKRWVADNRDSTDAEIYKKAVEMGIEKKHRTVQALAEGLFTEDIVAEIPKHGALFLKIMSADEDKSDKFQKSLLGGVERLVGLTYPDLVPATPKVLMALYQAEILEEDSAITWGKHVSKKYVPKDVSKQVRLSARPFIKWLEEQESDDEEDEEDE